MEPKETLISSESLQIMADNKGKASLPLKISGNIYSPSIALNQADIEERIKNYAVRKAEAEKNRVVGEVKKRLKNGLGNIFK